MLNKNQIMDIIKNSNLDDNNYIVISGTAIVFLDIKDCTNDIDIAVTKDYYDYLLSNYDCKFDRNKWVWQ